MTRKRAGPWTGRRRETTVTAIGLVVAALAVGGDGPDMALINESSSLPRGLYVRTGERVSPGAVVAVAQPGSVCPYLAGLGMPGDVLLLKRVAAVEGDRVCAGDGTVQVPGREASRLERDRRGKVLPAWRECRVLEPDELFLLGDTPGSFDSRYFGPVRRSEVVGVYREVLTW